MLLRKSPRAGRYLDNSHRAYFVWCIYENESDFKSLIEFKEDADEQMVNEVFEFLTSKYRTKNLNK